MSKQRQHIIIVSSEFPPQPGGIGNHAHNLALALFNEKYDITILADQRSISGVEEIKFDKDQPFKVQRIKRRKFRLLMYFMRIALTFKCLKSADYVIATGKFSLWNVATLTLIRNVKTIAVIHGSEVNFKPFLLRKSIEAALNRMNHVVAVSNYTKTLVKHLNLEVSVIPNGINFKEWNLIKDERTKLKGYPTLTTVGRVSSRKGQLLVIKQLPKLLQYFPNIHYHCIGIPTEAKVFMKIANQLGVASHVTFHGSVEFLKMKQALSDSDIFVMLSTQSKTGDVEGFGIAILEANALGIPSIGSLGCGIEDAINNNYSGVLVPPENTEAFKKAITMLLDDKSKFKQQAVKWAQAHDWSIIVKNYMSILD